MFTLTVWAVLTAGALAFVAAFGSNAPYADEWEFVPVLLRAEPVGPWLWAQHNEHRLPLPRAAYYALFRLTRDFRAGMLLQVGLLSALSLGLMGVAARLRGRPAWADAFFPLSLLHLGHWENFVMGYQLCFALFTVLVSGVVVAALRATRGTAFRSGVTAGVLVLLLALTGGSGLAVVPPVAAWVAYLAAAVWRDGRKGRAAVLLLLAAAPVAYAGLYFAGYRRPADHPPAGDPVAVAVVAGQVLAMGFGAGVTEGWWAYFAGEVVVGTATAVLLFRQDRGGRAAALGLAAVAAGVCGVALAVGVGRAGMGSDMGLWSRYGLLSWPLLGAAYLAWAGAGRRWVPNVLCVAAALAFPANTHAGMAAGHAVRGHYDRLRGDARAGLPADEIVRRPYFRSGPNAGQTDRVVRGVPLLREAGVGVFAGN